MVLILELIHRVDPARDPDLHCGAGPGIGEGAVDGDSRCGRKNPTDAIAGAERAKDQDAGADRARADRDQKDGGHPAIIVPGLSKPESRGA